MKIYDTKEDWDFLAVGDNKQFAIIVDSYVGVGAELDLLAHTIIGIPVEIIKSKISNNGIGCLLPRYPMWVIPKHISRNSKNSKKLAEMLDNLIDNIIQKYDNVLIILVYQGKTDHITPIIKNILYKKNEKTAIHTNFYLNIRKKLDDECMC